jgi:O-acetyl-ADP-ribose deacetylase (regulator of RNase III)
MLITKGNVITMALQGKFDVLVHGCNCFGTMGAGVARHIATLWPEALEVDRRATTRDRSMLGSYSKVLTKDENDNPLIIINAYTQFGLRVGPGDDVFEYDAFAMVLDRLAEDFPDMVIGMPAIGCGLAGGDKDRILSIIENSLANDQIIFVELG